MSAEHLLNAITDLDGSHSVSQLPPMDIHRAGPLTIAAVDKTGETAAAELERAADQLEADAKAHANQLREGARRVREWTRQAHDEITDFCARAVEVIDTLEKMPSLPSRTITQ